LKAAPATLFPAKADKANRGLAMQEFARRFVREHNGAWLCVEAAELTLPSGRIQVAIGTRFTTGTRFMGVDVARLLEEHYRGTAPIS
jgi:hypothetical protein